MVIEKAIWIYWCFCFLAAFLVISKRQFVYELLSPASGASEHGKGYTVSLILGWITTLLAGMGYVLLTHKSETGSYQVLDLVTFALLNGTLEQFIFLVWFLFGCYLGRFVSNHPPGLIFWGGYLSYVCFSGCIHASFWTRILPSHEPATGVMVLLLTAMSLVWMWLVWRYRALNEIVAMHIVIDFLMIGHLNFPWFEAFQLR
ncbi:MAG: hypothetical protein WCD18_09855 [Thermosynechococcaceae cyanobacterium]